MTIDQERFWNMLTDTLNRSTGRRKLMALSPLIQR